MKKIMKKILFSLLISSTILGCLEAQEGPTAHDRERRAGVIPPAATMRQQPLNSMQPSRLTNPSQGLTNPGTIAPTTNVPTGTTTIPTNSNNLRQQTPYTGSTAAIPQNPFSAGQQASTPFAPAPAAGYGTGGRYAAAGVQTPQNATIPQNPFAAGQPTFKPAQAATIGQVNGPQMTQKPFANLPPQPVYSPYMYLYGGRSGGMDPYNMYVRPIQQQQQYDARMRAEVQTLQQTLQNQQTQIRTQNQQLQQWTEQNANNTGIQGQPAGQPAGQAAPQDGSSYFMNQYQQYFGTR